MAAQDQEEEERRAAAARVIQAKFRETSSSSRTKDERLEQSQGEMTTKAADAGGQKHEDDELGSDKRWDDALNRTKLQRSAAAASSNASNTPQARWQRAGLFAGQIAQAQGDSSTPTDAGQANAGEEEAENSSGNTFKDKIRAAKNYAQNRDPETGKRRPFNGKKDGQKAVKIKKNLEEQHWLELIDTKHRYGSNIKYYFEEWQASDETQSNFFHWLDHGKGKELSLPECPREKLESECISYLSVEQRRHYLVAIDKESGRLRWEHPSPRVVKHTGEQHPLVETTGRKWMDLGKGKGVAPVEIVPEDVKREAYTTNLNAGSSSSLSYSSDSSGSTSSARSRRESSKDRGTEAEPRLVRRTSSTSLEGQNAQNEKTKEKGDVWIYVSDSEYRLYLGIKQKGRFQHSSFLAGGPITSAGTLVVKDGQLVKCNPMSGHYRTKAVYFKRWIEEMEKQGADLSQVKIKGTEVKLWFIEQANTLHTLKGKTRRLKKAFDKKMHM